ncbi:major facilitator superfamily domain-containing protein 6-like, partial [Tropilaelaps mercedesae]
MFCGILFQAQACYLNYLAVVGHDAGVSTGDVALIFGFAPLAAVLLKPLAGMVADKTRNITAVIITCEIFLLVFCWGVFLSPHLSTITKKTVRKHFAICPEVFR